MSTGNRILEIGATRIGQRYVLGASVPLNAENWQGPWDCAEFCSWAVFQAAGIQYGTMNNNYTVRNSGDPATADAYTGFWDHDSRNLGQRISVAEASAIPGAMVLRAPTGRRGHIAISDGEGGTVEAKGSQWGVTRDVIAGRTWDVGVLVPGIHYDLDGADSAAEPAGPAEEVLRLTSPAMRGSEVRAVQRKLAELGYSPGPIDGIFGSKTEAAVIAFQTDQGLTVNGEVDDETRQSLFGGGGAEAPAAAFAAAASAEAEAEAEDSADTPSDLQWECSEGWRITGYYTPWEVDYPPVDMKTINVEGESHRFPEKFIAAMRMEGWARTLDGWYLGFWGSRYHRETEPKDSRGRRLEEGVVAVDPRLIEHGKRVRVYGVPAIEGRIFVAKDVGGAIQDKKIDVYCGEGDQARLKTYAVTKNDTRVCYEA